MRDRAFASNGWREESISVSRHKMVPRSPGRLMRHRWRLAAALLTSVVVLTGGAAVATQGWPAVLGGVEDSGSARDAGSVSGEVTGQPSADAPRHTSAGKADDLPTATPSSRRTREQKRLERLARKTQSVVRGRTLKPIPPTPTTTFRVATVNVLGDSHTARGGNKPGFSSGVARMSQLAPILQSQNLDLIGLQEFEGPQKVAFLRSTVGWSVFTGSARGHDSIAYRDAVWEYVGGGTGTIPYFHGNPAPMPWVTLRHRVTGQEVSAISIHNPTSNPRRGNNAGNRAEATRREVAMVRALSSSGNPVLLLGDFNERGEAFCMVTGGGDIIAANGGSQGGSCAPPPAAGIDWIFGTSNITFTEYLRQQDPRLRRTTDHPIVVARATIGGTVPASE